MTVTDYAHTSQALRNRDAKARALAEHLYDQLHTAAEVAAFSAIQRRKTERAAAVRIGSDDTWQEVVNLLHRRDGGVGAPPLIAEPTKAPEPGPEPAPAALEVPEPVAWVRPPAVAAVYDLEPCGCPTHPGRRIMNIQRHLAWHDLIVEQGGPAGAVTLRTLQASRGITATPLILAATVFDAKAIASGKRRASTEEYREAQRATGRRAPV